MALSRVGMNPSLESAELACGGPNLLTRLNRRVPVWFNGKNPGWARRKRPGVQCSSSSSSRKGVVEASGSQRNAPSAISVLTEEDSRHVARFKISDFRILNHVSVGLGGRADEIVFEAMVKESNSPLYNSKIVLRRLTSVQAQRRGRRAIEVLKKLVRKRLMYHSYSMQVHGYISSATSSGRTSFTLVHGYHGSFSLRHWLQQSDWLPTLEATLALDEESVRRVGDDKVGGPEVSRQLRLIRILMRDLLIGVNYLHSHGLAHTELRLENVHISPVDRHIKVGILGNAADFHEDGSNGNTPDTNIKRRQMMIAFDMRCVGFMMTKMVLRELMEPSVFAKFKSFLTKGNDPTCLREFLLPMLSRNSPLGNVGLQILDRNWGAGWNLLSLLLAPKPSIRIRCLDALRHPFLCGPRWKIIPSMDIIRWGLGSTAVRISEEYIYGQPQRTRLAHFIELMEMLNPHSRTKNWLEFLPGKWRLLYCTGRHIGLTLRQPPARVLVCNAHLTISKTPNSNTSLSFASDVDFKVMVGQTWPHDKTGVYGKMQVTSSFSLKPGKQLYLKEEETSGQFSFNPSTRDSLAQKLSGKKWSKIIPFKELPTSLPVAKLVSSDIDITLDLSDSLSKDVGVAKNVVQEVRVQVPPEMFDLTKLICGTYVDSRLLVLRGVNGSALLFTRSCETAG